MQALRKAIAETQLSNPQLSLKLGHSKKYLTNLLNDGCSTALQERLIEEINQVMAGTFKTDAMVIAELSQQLAEAQDKYTELNDHAIGNMIDKNSEIEELKNANAGLKVESDTYFNKLKDEQLEHQNTRHTLSIVRQNNSDLMDKIDAYDKTAQNDAETIQVLKSDAEYLLNKYERQKRFKAILCIVMSLLFALWVWFNV